MSNIYLVGESNQPFSRGSFIYVEADTPELAKLFYHCNLMTENAFLPHLLDQNLETGWASQFAARDETGVRVDDKVAFDHNVREYFEDRHDFADMYLHKFYSTDPVDLGDEASEDYGYPLLMKYFIFVYKGEFERLAPLSVINTQAISILSTTSETNGRAWEIEEAL